MACTGLRTVGSLAVVRSQARDWRARGWVGLVVRAARRVGAASGSRGRAGRARAAVRGAAAGWRAGRAYGGWPARAKASPRLVQARGLSGRVATVRLQRVMGSA